LQGANVRAIVLSALNENRKHTDLPYKLTNCTDGWIYALRGEHRGRWAPTPQELEQYDLVIGNLDRRMIPLFAEIIHKRPTHVKWVSHIEGCATDYLSPSPALLHVLDSSDLVLNINRATTGYIRSLSTTRTEWIGVPLPYEQIAEYATPPDLRRDEVLICPRNDSNPSIMAANALGLPIVMYLNSVSRKLRNVPLFLKHRYYGKDLLQKVWGNQPSPVPRIARGQCDLIPMWQRAGACRLWINLDPRYTWGRWVLDAATLGVPIIATESTCHAQVLFPETTVKTAFAVEEAIEIGKRLLADRDWAKSVCDYAAAGLSEYSPDACVRRLGHGLGIDLLAQIRSETEQS
jgi:hypothetical protein